MAHIEALQDEVLDSIAKELSGILSERSSSATSDEATETSSLLNPNRLGTQVELAETFPLWGLETDNLQQPRSMHELARSLNRWHHQIKSDGHAVMFAHSIQLDTESNSFSVQGVGESELAARIDEAIGWVDDNVANDPLVRMLVVPSYQLHGFWLLDDEDNSHLLVIDFPSQFTHLQSEHLYSSQEFLNALKQEEAITGITGRTLDARPDTLDFRDKMYEPTLVEVPVKIELENYKRLRVPVLDQRVEGACTGFGLATVANYLLLQRKLAPDSSPVSARMFYEIAKRYDEWPGEEYEGSSARGAMKGWHKHGICSEELWPYSTDGVDQHLTSERLANAVRRPLGAYYRVNHKDFVAMHSALAEVGILYATATVHAGWNSVGDDGVIPPNSQVIGGHAFAIVAYNEQGLWIQNSWGADWGQGGFALITYDDWLMHGTDVWVARLGAPIVLRTAASVAITQSAAANRSEAYTFSDLRPHIISIGNEGQLRAGGTYGTSEAEVEAIFKDYFPKISQGWGKKRLLLYAHGGLVSEEAAIQNVADYRAAFLEAEVYPVSFIWKSDAWTTIENILRDALRGRRPEGFLDGTKDFMLDRLDDTLEPIASGPGKALWSQMKENALMATQSNEGGARIALKYIAKLLAKDPSIEIHVVGHSAGAILQAPLIQMLTTPTNEIVPGTKDRATGHGLSVTSCTLWAPACTTELFKQTYLPAIEAGEVKHFSLFTLTEQAEQADNCADIYHKSLLYLVSNAFETKIRIPGYRDGEPLLGMAKFIQLDDSLMELFQTRAAEWILAPNTAHQNSPDHSTAEHHGGFSQDKATLHATLARILQASEVKSSFPIHTSSSTFRRIRQQLI